MNESDRQIWDDAVKCSSAHVLTVLHESGVNRLLQWASPKSCNYHMQIVSYPGGLLIRGDCGEWVFERLHDQFEFHRFPRIDGPSNMPCVSWSYWAEKCKASPTNGWSLKEFNYDSFVQHVNEHMEEREWTKDEREQVAQYMPVEDECTDEHAHTWLHEYETDEGNQFDDSYEWRFNDLTRHFKFVCYLLILAIDRYDRQKEAE